VIVTTWVVVEVVEAVVEAYDVATGVMTSLLCTPGRLGFSLVSLLILFSSARWYWIMVAAVLQSLQWHGQIDRALSEK
jgi:hypothetical protein